MRFSRYRFVLVVAVTAACLAEGTARSSPLADAAQKSDAAAVRALLGKHADVNAGQADGTTALHWASYYDDAEIAAALIGAKANASATNRYGMTPLSLACTNGSAKMISLLIGAGAGANSALPGGETALMTASRTGVAAAVQVLLAHGAKVDAKESLRGQTALMWAAADGNVEVVNLLLKSGADLHAKVGSGFTPLLFAVREGRIGVVKALLKAGADVNETIPTATGKGRISAAPRAGTSALILATANAHYELASYLLDAGADPSAIGPGYTALHVITIIRKPGGGDNDPAPDGSGNMTSLELVRKLVAKGANINARMTKKVNLGLTSLNTAGATPYFLAARSADAELMRALAALGADTSIPNEDNSTPLMAAAGLGTRSPGEDAGTENEVVEALQAALDLGAKIDAVDNNGETAMHGAAYKNLPGAVLFLASKGANIEIWNKKDRFGWTPLRIAEGYRFGNFKPSPDTMAAFHKVMIERGVKPVSEPTGAGDSGWKPN
jgi:ankyrin repeat protein